jgi:hypothetical protein
MIMIKMKPLLKESTWTNRKFGESLPTLEDYMSETYDDENCGDGHAVVSEAEPSNDDDKYVSVGWGKYKEKGKEDDENAPTFSKTDSGQFVKAGGDEKGGDAPEKEPAGKLGGGDFERDFEDDPDDIDNLDTALDDDPTRGDPDDSWDDEEGRAKPPVGWKPTRPSYTPSGEPASIGVDPDDPDAPKQGGGGDFTKSADYDMWSDDDELAISGTDSDDPAGGKGDAWMTGDDAKQKGMDRASGLAKKGMEKRPGGKQAEEDYQKADQMIKKFAGVDIEKAEYWAKKKKQAADAMMGEITIDGKKYKPITESINPTVYDPNKEIKRTWNKIKTRQFDRTWQK